MNMRFKIFFTIIAIFLVGSMALLLLISPSYQHSLEAKAYYMMGNYKKALELADLSYKEDRYNRMASTILTQSKLAMEYVTYLEDAKNYLLQIKALSEKPYVEKADKIRMKFMTEIMIERYPKLTPTVMIDTDLKKAVKAEYEALKAIHEKILDAL